MISEVLVLHMTLTESYESIFDDLLVTVWSALPSLLAPMPNILSFDYSCKGQYYSYGIYLRYYVAREPQWDVTDAEIHLQVQSINHGLVIMD